MVIGVEIRNRARVWMGQDAGKQNRPRDGPFRGKGKGGAVNWGKEGVNV